MPAAPSALQFAGTLCFALAILHTFTCHFFSAQALKYKEGTLLENLFQLLGKVEAVFGLWSIVFLCIYAIKTSSYETAQFIEQVSFKEAVFVIATMVMASTRPVLDTFQALIFKVSGTLPINQSVAFYATTLVLGPLLGSIITEPAAMTVTASLLLKQVFEKTDSQPFKYATLGLLFVHISIGGTLTHFAAPPILMVSAPWGWNSSYMASHFGWKALLAILCSTTWTMLRFKKEIGLLPSLRLTSKTSGTTGKASYTSSPLWIKIIHLLFLSATVLVAHYPVFCIALFLLFLAFCQVTQEFQSPLKLKEGLLVGFFLGGLVILGSQQSWWLQPLISDLGDLSLFLGATALTAVTDNAALTYLGTLVPHLNIGAKHALVSGAVVGGGLTIIANAPNPIGHEILNRTFGKAGMNAWLLFKAALLPTFIAGLCFWFL